MISIEKTTGFKQPNFLRTARSLGTLDLRKPTLNELIHFKINCINLLSVCIQILASSFY